MICGKCGKEIRDDAVFCPACGERIALQTMQDTGVQQAASLFAAKEQRAAEKGSKRGVEIAVAALVVVALAVAAVAFGIRLFGLSPGSSMTGVTKGDIITIGAYEQDGNTSNGKEPIEWEVLDVQGDRMLVVSRYVLDCAPYNKVREEVTWETCTLRSWLNRDFFNNAFSPEEQRQIVESTLKNPGNAYEGIPGGNDTQDKVFLLSVEEIRQYFSFNSWYNNHHVGFSEQLVTEATTFAKNNGISTYEIKVGEYIGGGNQNYGDTLGGGDYRYWGGLAKENYSRDIIGRESADWWLRSPATHYLEFVECLVDLYGMTGWGGTRGKVDSDGGVRPAMWVSS